MSAPARTGRGGCAHVIGRRLRTNTSGLAAIRFGYRGDALHVFAPAGKARTNYSTAVHGEREAMRLALKFRRDRGFPVPTIAEGLRQLEAWKARGGRS